MALAFALYTDHVWEDYYITYRSSKNLVTGHGLVYNHDDRLHTFTSPLGALLPAAASLLTGNTSDTGALWIFRLMCASAFGGAIALLVALARRLDYPAVATAFLALFVATDAKSLDFTINGMETAFMLLFLAYALWAHFSPGPRQWIHLGSAWAGLMWTRPDSFIYIGLVGAGIWLFNEPSRTGGERSRLLTRYLRAGLLTAALYGPWLLWAWWYYGSPVPHTIVAKGVQGGGLIAVSRFLSNSWRMPWLIWQGNTCVEGAFVPSYYMFGPWPAWMLPWGRALGTFASLLWLVPGQRRETRVASLAFYGGMAYLSFVPYFPFPWYYPVNTLLACFAIAGFFATVWNAGIATQPMLPPFLLRTAVRTLTVITLLSGLWLTWGVARQSKAQQYYIESGNRRVVGEWLREHAQPGDTVFLESLGYIGYYSNLKTYDWPGMSSREMVSAIALVGSHWGDLIAYLQPTWLVLRPGERDRGELSKFAPLLDGSIYEKVREFSQAAAVQSIRVPGRKLLEFDTRFILYHRIGTTRHDNGGFEIASPVPPATLTIGRTDTRIVHAPGNMIIPVPAGAKYAQGQFGFAPGANEPPYPTDGANFTIYWSDGGRREKLFERNLDPTNKPADRGLHSYRVPLPGNHPGRLILATESGLSPTKDWTCWTDPVFH